MHAPVWRRAAVLAAILVLGAGIWWWSRPPGNAETDRIANVVALAVTYPHSHSADDYLRAVLSKPAAQDGRLGVVRVRRLQPTELTQPMVAMTWRIHLAGYESGLIVHDQVTACYKVEFSYYEATRGPRRTACPPGDPLTAIPGPPVKLPEFPKEPDNPLGPVVRCPDTSGLGTQ